MSEVQKLIFEALKWIGYGEKSSMSNLSSFTVNIGNSNYTYFADWLSKNVSPSIYANGYAWCDTFVDFCFCRAFGVERAKELLIGFSAYTPTSSGYFKNKHQWYTKPQVGDLIFFKDSKRINHTGIVYQVDAVRVFTIEGNTSAGDNQVFSNGGYVAKKKYLLINQRISGYGRPLYRSEETEPVPTPEPVKPNVTIPVPEPQKPDVTMPAPSPEPQKPDAAIPVPTPEPEKPAVTVPAPAAGGIPDKKIGIDVSSYQGEIQWNKVKEAGIDFVLLRGITKNGSLDSTFEKNYAGIQSVSITCLGVYHFSYALDEQTAAKDAQNMIARLNGKKLDIWLDLEWSKQGALGKDKVTAIASAYVKSCASLGYTCHIYSNLDWYKNKYDPAKLRALGCKFWIARYPSSDDGSIKTHLKPDVGESLWQYSSRGTIAGIAGNVDMNMSFAHLST